LKVLHLAKNTVRNRGAVEIAKGLKELEELFLGGCEISKEGCLPIARNNSKLKKLSLGKNELSTDSIF
jgi:Ran GTPase-activating protein (RanGAP) involved in mRNA processing and transport